MAPVKILSMDGGARALLTCCLLKRLDDERPGLLERVDIFAGTSAGSATAALIASAETPRQGLDRAIDFWRKWHPFAGASPFDPRMMLAMWGHKAFVTHAMLHDDLAVILGDTRLHEVPRKLVIPTFTLDNEVTLTNRRQWTMEICHNLVPEVSHGHRKLVDLVLQSSSIPILQPVYQGHVDGGLYANNPAMCAMISAMDYLDASLKDVEVLSLGQGQSNNFMALEDGDVGYGKWLLDRDIPVALIKLVMEANVQATNYQCGRLLEDRYVRFDPVLAMDIEPDIKTPPEEYHKGQEILAAQVDLSLVLNQLDELNW